MQEKQLINTFRSVDNLQQKYIELYEKSIVQAELLDKQQQELDEKDVLIDKLQAQLNEKEYSRKVMATAAKKRKQMTEKKIE